MATTLRPCPNCRRPMDAGRQLCVFCEQAGAWAPESAPSAPTAARSAGPQIPTWVGVAIFMAFILFGGIYLFIENGGIRGVAGIGPASYEVRVRTSPEIPFKGHYAVTSAVGGSSSKSVEGVGSATYTVGRADVVSIFFQKGTPQGTLTAEIWRNGQMLRSETTTAEFGVVTLVSH